MSSKSREKRTYVRAKGKRICILLAIGEQEREMQNAQVNFIKVWRPKKKKKRSLEVQALSRLVLKTQIFLFDDATISQQISCSNYMIRQYIFQSNFGPSSF